MSKIEISKQNLEAAYKVADENGKKLLDALFGKAAKANTPNLDDYKSIKTYEDACEALGLLLSILIRMQKEPFVNISTITGITARLCQSTL